MKYIRTKDGKIWSFSNPNDNFLYEGRNKKNGKLIHEIGEIVKEADTIEELFDCYADYCEAYNYDILCPKKPIRRKNHEIYGAVRIGDNFKYIAKMNEKGEFELL